MTCVECGEGLDPSVRTGRPRRYCSRSCQSRAYRRRRDLGRLAGNAPREAGISGTVRLIDVAIAIADAEGIESVTLRAVAHRAEVPFRLIQRRYSSRDRLVESMVQTLLARRGPAGTRSVPVVDVLAGLAEHEWSAYRAHPWLVRVLASSRPPLTPAVLDATQAYVEAFAALGLDTETAFARYLALSAYIQGMALLLLAEQQESDRSGWTYSSWWSEAAQGLERTGARHRHRWLDQVAVSRPTSAPDIDRWFRDGLGGVVAGLARSAP